MNTARVGEVEYVAVEGAGQGPSSRGELDADRCGGDVDVAVDDAARPYRREFNAGPDDGSLNLAQ